MYEKILKEMLPAARLENSYCVAEQAKHLAKVHQYDEKKAWLAGLLHDITRALSKSKQLNIISEAGLQLDEIQRTTTKLLHSISGSIYIERELDIVDEEIISAIRYHTTARARMSVLEKIIYLADFTSADRKFIDVYYMRELVDRSLDEGMKFGVVYTIRELIDKSSKIHPDTFNAYNYYISL